MVGGGTKPVANGGRAVGLCIPVRGRFKRLECYSNAVSTEIIPGLFSIIGL